MRLDSVKKKKGKVSDGCTVISIMPSFFWDVKLNKKKKKKIRKNFQRGDRLYSDLAAVCAADERRTLQNKPKHFKEKSKTQAVAKENVKKKKKKAMGRGSICTTGEGVSNWALILQIMVDNRCLVYVRKHKHNSRSQVTWGNILQCRSHEARRFAYG